MRRNIEQARHQVEHVRRRLLRPSPAALDRCLADIESAIACMRDLESQIQSGGQYPELVRAELACLQRELNRVSTLMETAGRFYQGWARLISSDEDAPANYTRKLVLHG